MEITDFDRSGCRRFVTEMNPAAQLAYRRLDQMVREFNQIQVELLKQHSRGRLLASSWASLPNLITGKWRRI